MHVGDEGYRTPSNTRFKVKAFPVPTIRGSFRLRIVLETLTSKWGHGSIFSLLRPSVLDLDEAQTDRQTDTSRHVVPRLHTASCRNNVDMSRNAAQGFANYLDIAIAN